MHPLVVDALLEEFETLGEIGADVLAGQGLAGPLAIVGVLLIVFSVAVVGLLSLGGILAALRPN